MYVLTGFLRTFLYLARGFRTILRAFLPGSRRNSDERVPILHHQQSLTQDFEGFEQSLPAVRLCLLHCFIYYTVAVVAFTLILEPSWTVVDSLYYATVLFTTIGYGDLSPTTIAGEVFTIVLCLYGITILGIFLGIYGGSLVEANEQYIEERHRKLKKDIVNRIEENATGQSSRNLDVNDEEDEERKPTLLREIWDIIVLETPIMIMVIIFGQIIGHFEGWNFIDSLYWTVITGTTVGFGDKSPQEQGVRLASVFFLPLAVVVLGEFLGRVAGAYVGRNRRLAEKKFFQHSLTLADIRVMDADKNGQVDRAEFLSYMLVTLQRVDREELDTLNRLFTQLDATKSGFLSAEDLRLDHRQQSFRQQMRQSVVEGPLE